MPPGDDAEDAFLLALTRSPFNYQIDWKVTNEAVLEDLANQNVATVDTEIDIQGNDAHLRLETDHGTRHSVIRDLDNQNQAQVAATLLAAVPDSTRVYRLLKYANGDTEDLMLLTHQKVTALRAALGPVFDQLLEYVPPLDPADPP
ncbi:hypothetical protein [Actinophytocola sp.]|uniref:hypothetical protein n=1 Tax=Actinophytocola sp. TaxID=1872138 RepID=UPI003D6A023C